MCGESPGAAFPGGWEDGGAPVKKEMRKVTELALVLLCGAGLYLALLEDRFRLWATVACYFGAYLLSLGVGFAARALLGPTWAVAAGALALFAASLFLSRDNVLSKLFLAILLLSNTLYLETFLPLALGVLPGKGAGAWGAVCSVGATALLAAVMGLCLYRPYRHFSGRGPSAFMAGMCLLQLAIAALCHGRADFLFTVDAPAQRLGAATLLYLAVVFAFRSVYQGGRYSQRAAREEARRDLLEMKSADFADALSAVKEARAARMAGEYALDTARVMVQDGNQALLPQYVATFKEHGRQLPILQAYSENDYLSAVIALKAAFAAQNNIRFECNAQNAATPLSTGELCVIAGEMLARACADAAAYEGERKVRFTLSPGEDALTVEAVYSADPPQAQGFSWRGKNLSQLLEWLFDDAPPAEDTLRGLQNTREIVRRYSGRLSVSGAPGETILQLSLRF